MNEKIQQTAHQFAQNHKEEQAELLRTLGKIPAPSHQEGRRAVFVRDWLLAQGAADVVIDDAQNVVCKIGPMDGELIVFAAHTDIVFPDTEPLPMAERDGKLFAPGIGDDTANLVNLLLCAKYLLQSNIQPKRGLLLAAARRAWGTWTAPSSFSKTTAGASGPLPPLTATCPAAPTAPWVLTATGSPARPWAATPLATGAGPTPSTSSADSLGGFTPSYLPQKPRLPTT